jgi:hypothetical protein
VIADHLCFCCVFFVSHDRQNGNKRKALRSELFTKDLFEERNLPRGHEKEKTHREVQCLICL